MKKLIRPALLLIISLLLVFISVAFSSTRAAQSSKLAKYSSATFLLQTTTATPQPEEDRSEIGSTDGITVMSFVIVAIIIIPIILKRKSWAQL